MTAQEKMSKALEQGELSWKTFGQEAYQQMSVDQLEDVAIAFEFEDDEEN